jgi:hypothetical protein
MKLGWQTYGTSSSMILHIPHIGIGIHYWFNILVIQMLCKETVRYVVPVDKPIVRTSPKVTIRQIPDEDPPLRNFRPFLCCSLPTEASIPHYRYIIGQALIYPITTMTTGYSPMTTKTTSYKFDLTVWWGFSTMSFPEQHEIDQYIWNQPPGQLVCIMVQRPANISWECGV